MTDEHPVKLRLTDGSTVDGVFTLSEDFDPATVSLSFEGRNIEASGVNDYFEGFCEIRKELEKEDIYPLCLGSSMDVYPSGMSRSMGGGMKGYRLSLGKQARMTDLVSVFEASKEVTPSKVTDQTDYFKKWIQSLGK